MALKFCALPQNSPSFPRKSFVIPVKTGIQFLILDPGNCSRHCPVAARAFTTCIHALARFCWDDSFSNLIPWIPASAGMTT